MSEKKEKDKKWYPFRNPTKHVDTSVTNRNIASSCLSFDFYLHTIIPLPCNLYKVLMPCAVTPQGRVPFALSVFRGHLFVFIRFSLCFCQGCSMRSGWDLTFEYLSQFYIIIIIVSKGPPATKKTTAPLQSSSRKSHLKNNKPHHFFKLQFYQHTAYSCHTKKNQFWFKTVSSGSLKMITLFVRETKYSYAILNLLCLGCSRYAVPK